MTINIVLHDSRGIDPPNMNFQSSHAGMFDTVRVRVKKVALI